MRRKELVKLISGFRRFKEKYFEPENSIYRDLSTSGQSPKTLVIGCSDSRVDPAIITSAAPGELFVVRNVAALVPPYETAKHGLHGVSAAIEFAVVNLKVNNIVILGHRQCGGIRALMTNHFVDTSSFVDQWMTIARPAKDRVLEREKNQTDAEHLCQLCEQEAIVESIKNLKTFPFVMQAIEDRDMNLIGAYFDLELGRLMELTEDQSTFVVIDL
jgi:carbonic anhydrase